MKSSFSFIAVRLVIVLWLAAVCRVSFSKDDSETWKTEQKNREKVFLCGAADLFVEWNVTFGALQKRAEKVNATATKILRNLELYKNSTGVKHNTSVAIEMVMGVMSNTSAALNVSRGFMDGIERDFFNAFEAVKDYPENFTFGYSNGVYNGKRESEILEFFKNVTKLFTECKNRTGRNVTIDLLGQEVMNEVDNETTNLTEWEEKRKTKWNGSLTNATAWLSQMQNYTYNHSTDAPKRTVNIWAYNVTAWDTIKKDCYRIAYNCSNSSTVSTIVNSSRLNILRHLQDIANQSTANDSLKENGCEGAHELFQSTVSAGFSEVENNESKLKEMCRNFNETLQNGTCTTNMTSIGWMRHRFNVAVPEMIERLSKSLIHLMSAEKLVMGTFTDLFTSRREALCNETHVVRQMNNTFDTMAAHDVLWKADIKFANSSLVSADRNISEAKNKSDAALKLVSEAQVVTSGHLKVYSDAHEALSSVKSAENASVIAKGVALVLIGKAESEQKEVEKVRSELGAARDEKKSRLEAISKNFSDALEHAKNDFAHDANVCGESDFVAPNVSIYVAEAVFAQLMAVNFSADSTNGDKLLERCTQKVKAMREFVKEIALHSNATRDNASQALQNAIVAESKSKEVEKNAIDVVKGEINKKRNEICAAGGNMIALFGKVAELERQLENHYKNLSAVGELSKETMNRALVVVQNCTAATTIAMEAVITVLKTTNETGHVVDANSSCAKAFVNVTNEDGVIRRVLSNTETTKAHVEQMHGGVNTSLAVGKSQLEQMKGNFTALSEFTNDGHLASAGSACSLADINVSELTLENATKIYLKLSDFATFNASRIEASLTLFGNVVSGISSNLDIAVKHHKGAAGNAKHAEIKAKEVEKETRAVLNKALEKQRKKLCGTIKQLTEINGNTTVLQKEASLVRESANAHWKRAVTAGLDAEEAAARAVAAEPHAFEATLRYQMTSDTARNTRIDAGRVIKNATFSLHSNKERIRKINSKFAATIRAISSQQCEYKVDVCKSAVVCNVTSDLEKSLRDIRNLTALMNITVEKEALTRLSLSEKNVKELMQETSRRANATEAAAAAALNAAEDSKCTPLYLQLLHVVDNLS
ncbi:hypothetical protein, conserved in T. vivax [Trypanosoma vivax Y486]|uniref:Uncharacterized protein n=1 Tax=Trypanosoma vivax (strain Y486) TaxID=1055687 RepID=F9WW03_TRYVY|nr:hypothetical protein, conserved in T. vivax [Trypanosoma vivax Y486]|eukprot:CCD21768.1 hypothetical protein, conserved in T. vivax [Trypanosoma vivax Y486]